MVESILKGKRILAVDDEPDVLRVLQEEILETCPDCRLENATTYEKGAEMLRTQSYDLVILDIMGVRGFDLLDLAVNRGFKVVMLTAHSFNVESLKRSFDMKARAYIPKDKLGDIGSFLEDALTYEYMPGWKRLLERLKSFFDSSFESDWEKKISASWRELGRPT